MSKIPTAEELLQQCEIDSGGEPVYTPKEALERMIEFAKLHVKAALKAAAKEVDDSSYYTESQGTKYGDVNKLILNAYPETNIV